MSMPSDVTSDVTEAVEDLEAGHADRASHHLSRASRSLLRDVTPEQAGFAAAVFVAFLGVAVLGPRLVEWRKPRHVSLREKAERAARDARQRAGATGRKAQKKLRRLGGGAIRR